MKNTLVLLTVIASLALRSEIASAQGFSPEQAVERMTVPAGLEVGLVASEPMVRQPVCIEFDDRGRLWVIQYLQYPNPAGLTRVKVDRYSRTKYDRIPKPPPYGPRGADRITILEDRDGNGQMEHSQDFVSGLNLASGIAFGHGGVFVLNVPYLLFYPDRNRDDIPDSDPEVLLTGFGMDDAHSVANSLTWGPDGWLYGCQGSTVTAQIRGIEFQQGVWRYHPATRKFELFCEGGGNAWGLDFDRHGNLLYSTNYGGYVLVHGVQGAYYIKSFSKHGALHNPHAYGYFNHANHLNFVGGHVSVGGLVYQGDSFPKSLHGTYVAGDLLGHGVYWHHIEPNGTTVQTAHGGELLKANDTWFAPTDITMGPDGSLYISDWHDQRTAHPDPDADWDRSNGRIYRVAAAGSALPQKENIQGLSIDQLFERQKSSNQWHARRARREIANRYNDAIKKRLIVQTTTSTDEASALAALWTINLAGGFNEPLATELLTNRHPSVRSWTVRLLGDPGKAVSDEMAHRLDQFAENEPSNQVRLQLACSSARLPAHQAVPIINANINRDIDNDDPFLPLLWWWAVERHSVSGRDEVLRRFIRPTLWDSHLGRETLLTRLIRRYSAEATIEGLDAVALLLNSAPNQDEEDQLWQHILVGWKEIPQDRIAQWKTWAQSHELSTLIQSRWEKRKNNLKLLEMGITLGHSDPFAAAMRDAFDTSVSPTRRRIMIKLISATGDRSLVEHLLAVACSDEAEQLRIDAIKALAMNDETEISEPLIALHMNSTSAIQSTIRDVLLSREQSAHEWLKVVDRGEISPQETPLNQIRRVAFFGSATLDSLVTRHWGKLEATSREEKLAEVRRLNNDLRAAPGNPSSGKELFTKHCSACHVLFGKGTKLGPDLTTANRSDRNYLLISLVDPNSVIRKEFMNVIVHTTNGRVLTGFPLNRIGGGVTLVNAKNEKTTIPSDQIEAIEDSKVSLMPDNLYRQLKPEELRDLFEYLQSSKP